MFRQHVENYQQWLQSSIHLKTKFNLQGPSKRTSCDLLYPVSSVKERNRMGGKCKISRVLQSPVFCTQASSQMEASNRPRQAQHLPNCRKVQNVNTRVHPGLSDSRGMGVVDRPSRGLPSHSQPPKLKEVPKVLPQVASVSVHFPSLRTGHGPSGLYNDCKRGETDGPIKGNQTSPVPGQLANQGPLSGRSTSKHSDSGGPNSVLRVDNKSGEVQTKANSGVFLRGLWIPSRFSPCKTHSREMAQTSGFDPITQVKTCFDCKMFDVANWVACLNGENGPGGTPSHEALLVSPQGTLETETISAHLEWWQNPTNVMKGSDLHPKDHSIQLFTDASIEGWGTHLHQTSAKGKKATHKCSRAEGDFSGPSKVQGPVSKQNSVSCHRQLNSGSLHKQTRWNPLGGDVCSPVEDHDLVPSLPDNTKSQTFQGV